MADPRTDDLEQMGAWAPSLAWLAIQLSEQDPGAGNDRGISLLRAIVDHIDDYTYVVVEEIVDDTVGGSTAPWPRVDIGGRLRFPTRGHDSWSSDIETLQHVADIERTALGDLIPTELATRPIEVGDVFAMMFPPHIVAAAGAAGRLVLDVTWDARQAGKVADLRAHETPDFSDSDVARVGADAQMRALAEHRPVDEQDLVESEDSLEVDARFRWADEDGPPA
ncbi:hypothetical protein ACE2AJ_00535 [Aquihabitans daechungensis]|uniref:hypothetical protein n=1 Tax=Aquihabitans daechungensis TaxID=1052257 RepID=UPI003B9EC972